MEKGVVLRVQRYAALSGEGGSDAQSTSSIHCLSISIRIVGKRSLADVIQGVFAVPHPGGISL